MFYVSLKQALNNSLLHTRVKFETPRKRREIVQCTRCQRYGHTKGYCHHSPRCVKCTGNHLTPECTKIGKSADVKCVLCNGNHPANYKGCNVYKGLQQKMYPTLRNRQDSSTENQKIPSPYRNTRSYADVLNGKEKSNENEPENKSSHQQPSDMADLKLMMKTFMDQMSTMMTSLTTIVSKLV